MSEIWKEVVGFDGLYLVSNLGRVMSHHNYGAVAERLLSLQLDKKTGYVHVNLYRGGKLSRRTVHRLVLESFVSLCPIGMEGCHDDGDRMNNALSNLRWDTKLNNHADKIRHGTDFLGERNLACKTTEAVVRKIKERLKNKKHGVVTELARELGVKRSFVTDIKCGRTWSHITLEG